MSGRVSPQRVVDALTARGAGPWLGVPCSFLRPLIDYVIDREDLQYLPASNEGEALAIAAGAQLAGRTPVVMLQNSGLGNLVNPLASLNFIFRIPALLVITLRGEPGVADEPQHALMGRTTSALLDLLDVEHAPFPASDDEIAGAVEHAMQRMAATGLPFAFILRKHVVAEYQAQARPARAGRPRGLLLPAVDEGPRPSRRDAIVEVAESAGDALLIATTGKTGRELFEHADRDAHFYMVGSMGCASSLALGVAHESGEPVVVLDGDGAALMRLEAMAGIGQLAPARLVHVILDNESYESTGRQATISASVGFAEIAAACGYATACSASGLLPLRAALLRARSAEGPHLIHTRVSISTDPGLGRPAVAPADVAIRFRAELQRRRDVQ